MIYMCIENKKTKNRTVIPLLDNIYKFNTKKNRLWIESIGNINLNKNIAIITCKEEVIIDFISYKSIKVNTWQDCKENPIIEI